MCSVQMLSTSEKRYVHLISILKSISSSLLNIKGTSSNYLRQLTCRNLKLSVWHPTLASLWSLCPGGVVHEVLEGCTQCIDHSSFLPRPKGSMGNKALSHDSVFIFESASGNVAGDMLPQENIPGRVKTLQVRTSSLCLWCCSVLAVF